MTRFLGGPEPGEAIRARHARSLALAVDGTGRMFRIAMPGAPAVGSVGYWEREWRGGTVYEMGWMVLPEHQGQGLASGYPKGTPIRCCDWRLDLSALGA